MAGGFEAELEGVYLHRRHNQIVLFERLGAVAAAISFIGMALWDWRVDPGALPATLYIRLAIAGLLLGLMWVTYTPLGRRHPLIQTLAFATIFGGLSWILAVLPRGFEVGLPGLSVSMVLIPLVALVWSDLILLGALGLILPNLAMTVAEASSLTFVNVNTWLGLSLLFAGAIWVVLDTTSRRLFIAERELDAERRRADDLLHAILPVSIAERLKRSRESLSARYEGVSILFADLVGFTAFSATESADRVVGLLNDLFSRFDDLVAHHGLEKIKTIGDGYMAASGVPMPASDHAHRIAELGLAMLETTNGFRTETGVDWQIRIGIHTGPVVAGVIGKRKFAYDLWGDAVNVASRLESSSLPGMIQLSAEAASLLAARYQVEPRGTIDLRNRGEIPTFFLLGRKDVEQEPEAAKVGGPDDRHPASHPSRH